MNIGAPELIILLVIVLVLFGGGRVAKLGGELGTALREFRRGVSAGEEEKKQSETPVEEPPVEAPPKQS